MRSRVIVIIPVSQEDAGDSMLVSAFGDDVSPTDGSTFTSGAGMSASGSLPATHKCCSMILTSAQLSSVQSSASGIVGSNVYVGSAGSGSGESMRVEAESLSGLKLITGAA